MKDCEGGDLGDVKVRVMTLKEETPTSVLLAISAGEMKLFS